MVQPTNAVVAQYRVVVKLETYRKVRGWFAGLYNPLELKAVMRFMMAAATREEADKLAEYYMRAPIRRVGW